MLPIYESRCNSQQLRFEGPNLKEKWHAELLARTLEINTDTICSLGSNLFSMKSMSTPSHSYQVDLGKQSCNCVDWPRAWLCKHVTAAAHFFGDLSLLKVEHTLPTAQPIREGSANVGEGNVSSTLEDLLSVSRAFLTLEAHVPSSLDTSWSLWMVVAHVTALYHKAHTSENLLPEKDSIPPNKGMW